MEKVCFSDENVNETEGLEFFYNEMLSNVDENGKEEVFDRDNGYTSSMICEF